MSPGPYGIIMADDTNTKIVRKKKPFNREDILQRQHTLNQQQPQNSKQKVAEGVFRITTTLSRFRREIDNLATRRDTHELREKIGKSKFQIAQLINDTTSNLKQGYADDYSLELEKLARDFHKLCTEFIKLQQFGVEREKAYEQVSEPLPLSTSDNGALLLEDSLPLSDSSGEIIPGQQQQPQQLLLESEVVYNELLIEEREEEIKIIQQQVGDVNQIFKDLRVLVQDQGQMIIDIESNIESSHNTTEQATKVLEDSRTRQKTDSSLRCLYMLIFGLVLTIFIIVVLT